jgi:type 1 fimbria pilin
MNNVSVLSMACLLLLARPGHAACTFYEGMGPVITPASLGSRLIVSTLALPGQVLYTQSFVGPTTGLECTQPDTLDLGWAADPGPASGYDGVYATNLDGVGLRISEQTPHQTLYWPRRRTSQPAGHYTPSASYIVELIKTGPLQEGRLQLPSDAASRRYGDLMATGLRFSGDVDIVLNKPTCSVAPGGQQVPVDLGTPSVRDFHGPGSGSALKPFSLRLACEGGAGGDPLFVWVTLTDVTQPGNNSTVLTLRSDATARGIGVQVFRDNGETVRLGPDSNQVGNPGQWRAGVVMHGDASLEVPLQARYVQTESHVMPGTAGALATFTFAYN